MSKKRVIASLVRLQDSEYLGVRRIAGEALKKMDGKA
jgi:hypothetical protein